MCVGVWGCPHTTSSEMSLARSSLLAIIISYQLRNFRALSCNRHTAALNGTVNLVPRLIPSIKDGNEPENKVRSVGGYLCECGLGGSCKNDGPWQ